MKTVLTSGYAFTASAKTLDFTGTSGFDVKRLYAVLNLTRGALIYAVGTTGLGYASLTGSVLTLAFDTTAHANTDALMVLYEAPSTAAQDTSVQALVAAIGAEADAPAADDTSAASLVALVRRGLARWTTLLSRLPAGLGRAAAAASFGIALSNEDLTALVATGPGSDGFVVTPSDTAGFTKNARALYVGAAGDVNLITPAGTALLHKNVPAGATLAIAAMRVNATGTTATNILGYL